jgi:uncharacterized protein (TIGR02646 family)
MLRVTRSIPGPPILESARARLEQDQLRRAVERGQDAALADRRVWAGDKTVRTALNELFAGKCAYCETPIIDSGEGTIEHFRPVRRAIDADGSISSHHYWWLANEWTNLLLSCMICSRNKGNRFPVTGPRAEFGENLAEEAALLLNPCEDDPNAHLTFVSDGLVVGDTERGRATIETLALNREALIRARREQAAALFTRVEALGANSDLVRQMLDPGAPFAAMCRQVLYSQPTAHRSQLRDSATSTSLPANRTIASCRAARQWARPRNDATTVRRNGSNGSC